MRWHQTIRNNTHERKKILFHSTQKEHVILGLKENTLPIIPTIVEMIINIRNKWGGSTRHICFLHVYQTSEVSGKDGKIVIRKKKRQNGLTSCFTEVFSTIKNHVTLMECSQRPTLAPGASAGEGLGHLVEILRRSAAQNDMDTGKFPAFAIGTSCLASRESLFMIMVEKEIKVPKK